MKRRHRDEKRRIAAKWLLEQKKAVPRRYRTGVRALARCGGADTNLVMHEGRRTVVVATRATMSTGTYAKTTADLICGGWG